MTDAQPIPLYHIKPCYFVIASILTNKRLFHEWSFLDHLASNCDALVAWASLDVMHISTPYSYLDNGLGRVQVKTFEKGIEFLLPFNQFTGDEHCGEEFSHLKGFDILF